MVWSDLILIIVGIVTGFINTVAGGGSVIILPVLILYFGLPAQVANGTNRIGILVQTIFSAIGFKSKNISPFANKVLSVVMICVLILTIWKPKPSKKLSNSKRGYLISLIVFFIVGIYAGFIQAGTGFLLILGFTFFNGLSLVASNAMKTVVVFLLNIGALAVFVINNQVNLKYGILLAIGNGIGGWTASRWSVKKGERTLQIFMIIVVSLMAIKLWFY